MRRNQIVRDHPFGMERGFSGLFMKKRERVKIANIANSVRSQLLLVGYLFAKKYVSHTVL